MKSEREERNMKKKNKVRSRSDLKVQMWKT